jgi:hypothetical protein
MENFWQLCVSWHAIVRKFNLEVAVIKETMREVCQQTPLQLKVDFTTEKIFSILLHLLKF